MSFPLKSVKAPTAVATIAWLVASLWVVRGYVWPTLSNVEVAGLQAMLDPHLFRGDFAVQASLGFTPRFYWNELILLPARAGLPLAASFLVWHLVALGFLVTGLRATSAALGLGGVATAALIAWALCVDAGAIGGVYFYTHAPVPAAWAGAAVAWGAAFALRRQATAAYACIGGAVLLQFLVGFYAGVLALPLVLRCRPRDRWVSLAVFASSLALVFVPMWVSGGTNSPLLDAATFVEIYAQIRLPHHLVPSTWGGGVWARFALFYFGAACFLWRTNRAASPGERLALGFVISAVLIGLGINYGFVEVLPVALVAKLQLARLSPLAAVVVFALLAKRLDGFMRSGHWAGAALLFLIPFSPTPGLLFLAAAALLSRPEAAERTSRFAIGVLGAAVVLAFQPWRGDLSARWLHEAPWIAVSLVLLLPVWWQRRPMLLGFAAAAACAGATVLGYLSSRPNWPARLAERFAVNAPPAPDDAPGRLGRRFETRSPYDAVVLVAPVGETWTFKLFSRRADVVDTKNTPFTDAGLLEWRRRMEAVLGVRLLPGTDREAAWRRRLPEDLAKTAREFGAAYILTRDDWHRQIAGEVVDREGGWTLWHLR